MKIKEKKEAIKLRLQGKSIKTIARLLNVSRASVSLWVRSIALTPEQIEKLIQSQHAFKVIEKRRISRIKNEIEKREVIMKIAEKDFSTLSKNELKIIGIIFYWAEGGKTKRGLVRLANSDPVIIKIMMKFFREICLVKEKKFRGHIHTFSHLNAQKALSYWSGVTGIPQKQFFKVYVKKSIATKNKRDTLPFGTLDIIICDTRLFLIIMGWIRKISSMLIS